MESDERPMLSGKEYREMGEQGDDGRPHPLDLLVEQKKRIAGLEQRLKVAELARDSLSLSRQKAWNKIEALEAALRDCIEIAASDCEHEACKGVIKRAGELVQLED